MSKHFNFLVTVFLRAKVKYIAHRGTKRVAPVGVEPTTLGLLDPRSNQLS